MKLLSANLILFFISHFSFSAGNKTCEIIFHPTIGSSNCDLENWHRLKNGDSVKIETFKFYISTIELLSNDKSSWKEKNSFHLIDLEKPQSLHLLLSFPQKIAFNQIHFTLGIDSVTNVSGAMGGDLDPTLGMYWTWQSGYINFKLEGILKQQNSNSNFQYHLGGYQSPHASKQSIMLSVKNNERIEIYFDIESFLEQMNLLEIDHIMSPGANAAKLSKIAADLFIIKE